MSDAAAQRRARQNVINLSLSLIACLGIVLAMVLAVPRDDSSKTLRIDYVRIAQAARLASDQPILAPELPSSAWWSNGAEYKSSESDGVSSWYVGFVTENEKFVGLMQGFDANETWLKEQLGGAQFSDTERIGELEFESYLRPQPSENKKAKDEIFVLKLEDDYLLLYGTAASAEFEALLATLKPELDRKYR